MKKAAAKKSAKKKASPRKKKVVHSCPPDPRLKDPAELRRGKPVPQDKSLGIPPGIPISEWPQQT